jgi:hypothetical protein
MKLVKVIEKNGIKFEIYELDPELSWSIFLTTDKSYIELKQHYFNTIDEAVEFVDSIKKEPEIADSYVEDYYGFDPMERFFNI